MCSIQSIDNIDTIEINSSCVLLSKIIVLCDVPIKSNEINSIFDWEKSIQKYY